MTASTIALPSKKSTRAQRSDRQQQAIQLIKVYGDVCYVCATVLDDDTRTIDHFVPKSKGGTDAMINLRLACIDCNSEKKDTPYHDFVGRR